MARLGARNIVTCHLLSHTYGAGHPQGRVLTSLENGDREALHLGRDRASSDSELHLSPCLQGVSVAATPAFHTLSHLPSVPAIL